MSTVYNMRVFYSIPDYYRTKLTDVAMLVLLNYRLSFVNVAPIDIAYQSTNKQMFSSILFTNINI